MYWFIIIDILVILILCFVVCVIILFIAMMYAEDEMDKRKLRYKSELTKE